VSEHSEIGWTDATWPIVAGCEYVSPGCSNCWAVRDSWRLAHSQHKHIREAFEGVVRKTEDGKLVWTGVVRPLPFRLDWPAKWRAPRRIFVCSQSDLFNPQVPDEFIADVFGVMAANQRHTYQVLTKHAARMRRLLAHDLPYEGPEWPLPNVWIGVTVEAQRRADERVPELLRTPAAKRWLSVEPMLEPITLRPFLLQKACDRCTQGVMDSENDHLHGRCRCECHGDHRLDWVVCGGESAQTRETTRPFDIGWGRNLQAQCRAAGVPFFMKQLGSKPLPPALPGTVMRLGLPLPEGKTSRYKWHEPEHWPEDLRVQEFPT
jgi:protein gp37